MIGELIRVVLLAALFSGKGSGGGGGGVVPAGGGPSVPAGPFPSVKPADLPTWPSGWCPDLPPPQEVIDRAWALVPTLWANGEGTRTLEMTGGRWITYVATTVDGQKAVAAYRTTDCEPVAPSVGPDLPLPSSVVPPLQTGDPSLGDAIAMNEALRARGYKKSDMIHYQGFQQKAGLRADGYPGTITMLKLETVLKAGGLSLAPVKIYPWKAGGAYDGVNAPTQAEWEGVTVPASSPIAPPPGRAPAVPAVYSGPPPIVPAVTPALLNVTWAVKTPTDVQHALNAIGYGPLAEDGKIGPQSKAATLLYQIDHPPLAKDGIPGPLTMAALTKSIQANERRPNSPPQPLSIPLVGPGTYTSAPVGPGVVSPVDVQHSLNLLGYKGADAKVLTEDGKLGPNSTYAVKAFQKEHPPLAVDGIAGPQTKVALSTAVGRLTQAAA
jgi:peptidoglycan hydrolase-like protein with peptidoglycan-binding domain